MWTAVFPVFALSTWYCGESSDALTVRPDSSVSSVIFLTTVPSTSLPCELHVTVSPFENSSFAIARRCLARGPLRSIFRRAGAPREPAGAPGDTAGVLVTEVVEDFFAARRPRKESGHTTAAYRRDLATIAGLAADVRGVGVDRLVLTDLDRDVLRRSFGAYADDHASATVLRTWSAWNQFFTFAVAEGLAVGNPMAAVARPRRPPRKPKPLAGEDTPEQLLSRVAAGSGGPSGGATPRRELPDGADGRDGAGDDGDAGAVRSPALRRDPWPERDLAVLALALVTGLRSAELLSLTMSALVGRPGERRIHVVGKGGKSRSVPVEDSLEAVLDGYLRSRAGRFPGPRPGRSDPLFVDRRGAPLRRGGLQYLVRTAYRHAGLDDRVPVGANVHALRHTFATRLAEDGATASEIMTLLGHASIATSQGYIDATSREQRAAAAANRTYRVLADLAP